MNYYILKGRIPVKVSLAQWREWVREVDKDPDQTVMCIAASCVGPTGIHISTSFSGYCPDDDGYLFETNALNGAYISRANSYDQAILDHCNAIQVALAYSFCPHCDIPYAKINGVKGCTECGRAASEGSPSSGTSK